MKIFDDIQIDLYLYLSLPLARRDSIFKGEPHIVFVDLSWNH